MIPLTPGRGLCHGTGRPDPLPRGERVKKTAFSLMGEEEKMKGVP